jgi:hypothetical protein
MPLPDFADAWMQQWRHAAKELQRVRDDELRALPPEAPLNIEPSEVTSGLVTQQRWFMRQRILMSVAKQASSNSSDS